MDHFIIRSGEDGISIDGPMPREHAAAIVDLESERRAVRICDRFLGCDPAHAERADCERFGIAPGIDAGANGFARTRDGFAVDFRRVHLPPGAIVGGSRGQRSSPASHFVGPLTETVGRFVGLDVRHAHPEDVRRLCCGERPATWTSGMSTTMNRMPQRGFSCTLAIGDHDEHEDIASGVKWPAKPTPVDAFAESEPTGRTCPSCGAEERRQKVGAVVTTLLHREGCAAPPQATVEFGDGFGAVPLALNLRATSLAADGSRTFTLKGTLLTGGLAEQQRVDSIFHVATSQGEEVRLHHYGETIRVLPLEVRTSLLAGARGVEVSMLLREVRAQAEETTRGGFQFAAARGGASWTPGELPPGALYIHGGGRHWMKLTADGVLSCSCGSATEHADNCDAPASRADADVGLRVLRDGGTLEEAGAAVMARVERRKREAGLVELVNAVPEGLDPIGWRAAVLAAHEQCPDSSAAEIRAWLTPQTLAGSGDFACAYRRAIAPHKAPPPERKQRGPRLTVDDGRDE